MGFVWQILFKDLQKLFTFYLFWSLFIHSGFAGLGYFNCDLSSIFNFSKYFGVG